jgi:hypothetical protein
MRRSGRAPSRRLRAGALLLVLISSGCGLIKPAQLDVPPGHSAVVGRIDLTSIDVGQAIFDIVKEDGSFLHELVAGPGREDFALVLPNGRYWFLRVRTVKERGGFPNTAVAPLRVAFDVGPEPAAYIGTIRLEPDFRQRYGVTIIDDYDRTVAVLRGRYADLPAEIVRRLAAQA